MATLRKRKPMATPTGVPNAKIRRAMAAKADQQQRQAEQKRSDLRRRRAQRPATGRPRDFDSGRFSGAPDASTEVSATKQAVNNAARSRQAELSASRAAPPRPTPDQTYYDPKGRPAAAEAGLRAKRRGIDSPERTGLRDTVSHRATRFAERKDTPLRRATGKVLDRTGLREVAPDSRVSKAVQVPVSRTTPGTVSISQTQANRLDGNTEAVRGVLRQRKDEEAKTRQATTERTQAKRAERAATKPTFTPEQTTELKSLRQREKTLTGEIDRLSRNAVANPQAKEAIIKHQQELEELRTRRNTINANPEGKPGDLRAAEGRATAEKAKQPVRDAADTVKQTAAGDVEAVKAKGAEATEKGKSAWAKTKQKAGEAWDATKQKASNLRNRGAGDVKQSRGVNSAGAKQPTSVRQKAGSAVRKAPRTALRTAGPLTALASARGIEEGIQDFDEPTRRMIEAGVPVDEATAGPVEVAGNLTQKAAGLNLDNPAYSAEFSKMGPLDKALVTTGGLMNSGVEGLKQLWAEPGETLRQLGDDIAYGAEKVASNTGLIEPRASLREKSRAPNWARGVAGNEVAPVENPRAGRAGDPVQEGMETISLRGRNGGTASVTGREGFRDRIAREAGGTPGGGTFSVLRGRTAAEQQKIEDVVAGINKGTESIMGNNPAYENQGLSEDQARALRLRRDLNNDAVERSQAAEQTAYDRRGEADQRLGERISMLYPDDPGRQRQLQSRIQAYGPIESPEQADAAVLHGLTLTELERNSKKGMFNWPWEDGAPTGVTPDLQVEGMGDFWIKDDNVYFRGEDGEEYNTDMSDMHPEAQGYLRLMIQGGQSA